MKSRNYDKVKGYYENGLWSRAMVTAAIGKWITSEEAEEIFSSFLNERGD